MNEQDKSWWEVFRGQNRPYLENDEYKMVCEIHARIFDKKVEYPCKCNPIKIQKWINEINEEYSKYE